MSATRGLRAILASAMVTGVVLVAPGASAGNFALDVATVTSPFAPLLRNEILSMFSILESVISKLVLPLDNG